MENRTSLTVRTRFWPYLRNALSGYLIVPVFGGIITWAYYKDIGALVRALCTIGFVELISVILDYLHRPTLRLCGAKIYIRAGKCEEVELYNIRVCDIKFVQYAADRAKDIGTIRIKGVKIPAYATRNGADAIYGVEQFSQVHEYIKAHFPA